MLWHIVEGIRPWQLQPATASCSRLLLAAAGYRQPIAAWRSSVSRILSSQLAFFLIHYFTYQNTNPLYSMGQPLAITSNYSAITSLLTFSQFLASSRRQLAMHTFITFKFPMPPRHNKFNFLTKAIRYLIILIKLEQYLILRESLLRLPNSKFSLVFS